MVERDYNVLKVKLGKLQCSIDDLILSLTHKSILNEKNLNNVFLTMDYYSTIGKSCFEFSIMSKLLNENSLYSASALSIITDASKNKLLLNMIESLGVSNYVNIGEQNRSTKNILAVSLQMIGCLITKNDLVQVTDWITDYLDFSLLEYTDDYYNVVRTYFKTEPSFELIKVDGQDHNKKHTMRMTLDKMHVEESSSSKKNAKKKCSKSFALKYMDKYSIQKFSGIKYEKRNKSLKNFELSKLQEKVFKKLSNDLSIKYSDVVVAFTHKSVSNEFNLMNNSNLRALGSEIERIFIATYIYNNCNVKNYSELMKILGYLSTNIDCCSEIINKFKIRDVCICNISARQTCESIDKVTIDSIKALIFYEYKSNGFRLLKIIARSYDSILRETTIKYIDPRTQLQELIQYYTFLTIDEKIDIQNDEMIAEIILNIEGGKFKFFGRSKSKLNAISEASTKILRFIYEGVIDWIYGDSNVYDERLLYFFMRGVFENFSKGKIIDLRNDGFMRLSNKSYQCLTDDDKSFFIELVNALYRKDPSFTSSCIKKVINYYLLASLIIFEERVLLSVVMDELLSSLENNIAFDFISARVNLEKKSELMIIRILESNCTIIQELSDVYDDIILKVLENDGNLIQFVTNPSAKMIKRTIFRIQDLNPDVLNYIVDSSSEFVYEKINHDILKLKDSNSKQIILSAEIPFELYLNNLLELDDIEKVYIATGFVYKSGLELIETNLKSVIDNGGVVEIIAGNLKEYLSGRCNNQMDRNTAEHINYLINSKLKFYGCSSKFYHGKLYYIKQRDITYVIHGSTNLSYNAFRNNIELDVLNCSDQITNAFENYYDMLKAKSELIENLSLELFYNREFTNTESIAENQKISRDDMNKRISLVPDEDLRERLNMWLLYNPSDFYDNIPISKNRYIAIEYIEKSIVVLETFIPGNSYFVFYDETIDSIKELTKAKSKNEIFELSGMNKRGYHIRNMLNLEMKIKSYFLFN